MALPVLDGNQSATTLSSVVTGGEHIVAHTVVSLGSTAISNITSAVSGVTIAGTVTANVFGRDATGPGFDRRIAVNSSGNTIVDIYAGDGSGALSNASGLLVRGTITIGSLPAISGTVTVGSMPISAFPSELLSGGDLFKVDLSGIGETDAAPWLKFGGGNVPVAGTVTANVGDASNVIGGGYANLDDLVANASFTIGSLPAISGTVTAAIEPQGVGINSFISQGGSNAPAFAVGIGYNTESNTEFLAVNDSGNNLPVAVNNSVTIGAMPRVTFLDGSGTVTTANSAITVFASSSTRSYLLVQVTTGSAFVNVGATATTLNGINLTAGQGYAWETTIPQGIVSLISVTTSTNYVAKEA